MKLLSQRNSLVSNYYRNLASIVEGTEVDFLSHLSDRGLSLDEAFSPCHPHSLDQYYSVLSDVLARDRIPGLGFRFGQKMKLIDYGIFGYAILSCPTVQKVMDYGTKFYRMTTEQVSMTQGVDGNSAIVTLLEEKPLSWPQNYFLEAALMETWSTIKQLLPELKGKSPTKINLSYPAPSYAPLFEEIFQCPVCFDQEETQLWFPDEWLKSPITSGDEISNEVCVEQCELIISELEYRGDMVDRVRRLLISKPMTRTYNLEEIALEFKLSPRKFREELYALGTSYKRIATEVKMQTAMEYLAESTLSVQEVSYLVGYDHNANFFRAFKKAAGMTPIEYRKKSNWKR